MTRYLVTVSETIIRTKTITADTPEQARLIALNETDGWTEDNGYELDEISDWRVLNVKRADATRF